MASWFAALTNKEIAQMIKKAVPEIHEEGDEARAFLFFVCFVFVFVLFICFFLVYVWHLNKGID